MLQNFECLGWVFFCDSYLQLEGIIIIVCIRSIRRSVSLCIIFSVAVVVRCTY